MKDNLNSYKVINEKGIRVNKNKYIKWVIQDFYERGQLSELIKTAIQRDVEIMIKGEEQSSSGDVLGDIIKIARELPDNKNRKIEEYQKEYRKEEKNNRHAFQTYAQLLDVKKEYERDVECYYEPFKKIMACLVCFAGSTSDEEYLKIAMSLENEQENLCAYIRRYREVLEKLEKIPDTRAYRSCPLLQFNEQIKNLPEDEKGFLPEFESGYINEVNELKKRLNGILNGRDSNRTDLEKLKKQAEGLQKKWNQYKEDSEKRIAENRQNTLRCRRQFEQDRLYYMQRAIHWEYRAFLKKLLPLIYEIADASETEDKDWYIKIGKRARIALDHVRPTNGDAEFFLIDYGDEKFSNSEKIRVDFISGDACRPGLYCHIKGKQEECFCIIPGRNGNEDGG